MTFDLLHYFILVSIKVILRKLHSYKSEANVLLINHSVILCFLKISAC